MDKDRINELRKEWKAEEEIAYIHGWDFSHLDGRYDDPERRQWVYEDIVEEYLTDDKKLFDYDTGGGEGLLSLKHPYKNTAATEGYPPNVELCKKTLLPLGIDFRPCDDPSKIPFEDNSFDIAINRHGSFDPKETYRIIKPGGMFITEQVGEENNRDLAEMVQPDVEVPRQGHYLANQKRRLEEAGFEILRSEEGFEKSRFFDIGAFVWYARVIVWEFPGFSVDKCFDNLLKMQEIIDEKGEISGICHRYLIVARKL